MRHNNATAITPHRPKRRESGLIFHELALKRLFEELELYGDNKGYIANEIAQHRQRITEIKQSRM